MFEWNEVIIEDIPYFVFGLQSLLFHYLEVLQKNVRKLKVGLFKWCSPQAREIRRDHSGGVIPIFVPIPSTDSVFPLEPVCILHSSEMLFRQSQLCTWSRVCFWGSICAF
ncbi:Hypothetical predicted protein [Podarcis lilfordi]|uniref:Uncharacterized protein n=1 Tax=Podarcis lilfordi TaxID=74358 RepID=A0AA35L021_9SAUR|nr:Hypothetical predicted protein [Podarcis lilfordi]